MTTSDSNQEFTSYLRIIARRWWLLILLPAVTAAVILALSTVVQPQYTSSVKLQILPIDPQEVSLFSKTRTTATSEQVQAVHDEFYDAVRLPSVAWETIADLGLNISATELIDRLNTEHQTNFITVLLEMPSPELAQQAVTTHVENAMATYRDIRAKPAEISLEFIDAQLAEEKQTLAATEQALQEFQLENEVSDLNREITAYQDLRRALQGDRDHTLVEEERNKRLAEEYQSLSEADFAKAETLLASIPISDTTTTEETDDTVEDVEPVAPDPTLLSEIDRLLAQAQTYQSNAEEYAATAEGYRAAASEYERILNERQQQHIYLLGLQNQYEDLVSAVSRAEGSYDFLTDKANEAQLKLSQGRNIGYLQVAEPARLPNAEAPKRTAQLLIVGILVSLLVALVLAFLLEVLERSLGKPKEGRPVDR
jgi:capsular polysaccharide biosynthesis protein